MKRRGNKTVKHLEVSTSHACFNPVSTHKKVQEKLNFREQCVKFQECFQSWFISEAGGSFFLNLMQLKGKGGRFKMTLPETEEFASKNKPPTSSSSKHPFSGANLLLVSGRVIHLLQLHLCRTQNFLEDMEPDTKE